MELNTKDIGKKTSSMAKDWKLGQMEPNIMVTMSKEKSME
jgi:hypothetical protein